MFKTRVALRKFHHWSVPLIVLPLGLVIVTGLLLLLKKDFDWIQPATLTGQEPEMVPSQTLHQLFTTAQSIPELELENWTDLTRVDVRTDRGVVKFVSGNHWEAQVDTHTGEVLQVAYRRSDFIESLHDGSYFAGWTKHFVFLPAALVVLFLWASGIYLFFITQRVRLGKRQRLVKKVFEN